MLIELHKGFVKSDESAEVNKINLDVNKKDISEVIKLSVAKKSCKETNHYIYELIKEFDEELNKIIEDNNKHAELLKKMEEIIKTREEYVKSVEEIIKGKVKVQYSYD